MDVVRVNLAHAGVAAAHSHDDRLDALTGSVGEGRADEHKPVAVHSAYSGVTARGERLHARLVADALDLGEERTGQQHARLVDDSIDLSDIWILPTSLSKNLWNPF